MTNDDDPCPRCHQFGEPVHCADCGELAGCERCHQLTRGQDGYWRCQTCGAEPWQLYDSLARAILALSVRAAAVGDEAGAEAGRVLASTAEAAVDPSVSVASLVAQADAVRCAILDFGGSRAAGEVWGLAYNEAARRLREVDARRSERLGGEP